MPRPPFCERCGLQLYPCRQCGALQCDCKAGHGQRQHYRRDGSPYPPIYAPLPVQKELEFDGLDRPMKDPRYICAQGHDVRGGEHRKQCVEPLFRRVG